MEQLASGKGLELLEQLASQPGTGGNETDTVPWWDIIDQELF